MSAYDLFKLHRKLDALEARLDSQESELSKVIFSSTCSILDQTDGGGGGGDMVSIDVRDSHHHHQAQNGNKTSHTPSHPRLCVALKKHILEWMKVSSWSGPGIIIRVKSILRKIYWTLIFLLCMAATIYVLVLTVNAYLLYGEVTTISVMSDVPTNFPTITICSLNPFEASFSFPNSFVPDHKVAQDPVRHQKLVAMAKYQQLTNASSSLLSSSYSSTLYSSFQQNILTCKFKENACNINTDFEYFFSSDYSYCFKFNSDLTNLKTTNMPGPSNGFEFSMFIGSSPFPLASKRGLRVFIHNSTRKYPIRYIDIQPGVAANVALKQIQFQHLPKPYTNCIADITANSEPQTDVMQYMFRNLSVNVYSYSLCQSLVFSYNLMQKCGCLDTTFLRTEVKNLCYTSEQIDCMNEFRANFNDDISSQCPLECNTINFDKEISYSDYLSDWYVDYMKNSLQPLLSIINTSTNNNNIHSNLNLQMLTLNQAFPQEASTASIRSNIVTFNVYFEDLRYNLISGTPQINWFSLFANLAGICGGSFLGMSFLAILEFFEYLIFLFCILFKYGFYKLNFIIGRE